MIEDQDSTPWQTTGDSQSSIVEKDNKMTTSIKKVQDLFPENSRVIITLPKNERQYGPEEFIAAIVDFSDMFGVAVKGYTYYISNNTGTPPSPLKQVAGVTFFPYASIQTITLVAGDN